MVTLSETLHYELALRGAKVKVSVPCPGWVSTRIADSERNRPVELQTEFAWVTRSPEEEAAEKLLRQGVAGGLPPELVADQVLEAIRNQKFYIFTHTQKEQLIRIRMEDMLEERNPAFVDPRQL